MSYTDNISLVAAIKNNLEYTKNFYSTTRKLYPDVEICFVSYDSIDGTNEWLDSIQLSDPNTKIFHDNDATKCFADTYNKAAAIATKPFIVFVHNDMVLCNGFLENLSKYVDDNTVVSYTTIEPPIFGYHKRPGKLIHDCGDSLDTFNSQELATYVSRALEEYRDKTEDGIVFFMCLPRNIFLSIGGFDNLFCPFFREDDDLIKRLKMLKVKYFTCLDSMCYHFVSKTSRFSEQYKNISQNIEYNNTKNYLRKWGSIDEQYTYNVDLLLTNCSFEALSAFEPIARNVYIENNDTNNLIQKYIELEQPNTKIPLTNKLHAFIRNVSIDFDIICEIDCKTINEIDIKNISCLQNIIHQINKLGSYKIENIILHIQKLVTTHKDKIKI